ncbi:MAG: fucose 4-O-acetylase-like acetyltransferase [Alphaproteobacteria bacterium]|jgi:fucose 4-O-acetylase-like acetyltransferase
MERQGFIDWLKAVGMLAIVIGHIVGGPYDLFNLFSQPVYTKQLGVCFFIFIMGWSLANEHKSSFKVVFNRVFPVYFYGFLFALLLSSIYIFTINDINESNYLPFFLGVNVFFNYFPANPTTWYIGTYLHILLFWFFFVRGHQITKKHLYIAIVAEISIRALFLYLDKNFIAYMFLPNWLTVFMLGGYLFQKKDTHWQPKIVMLVVVWAIALALWASPLNTLISPKSFPFRQLMTNEEWAPVLRSCLISIIYVVNTYVFFEIFRRLPKLAIVAFFARNSLITFIIHMPLIYALNQHVYSYFDAVWSKKLALIIIIFVGTAIVSEIIQKFVKLGYFQRKAWDLSSKLVSAFPNKKDS